MFGGKLIEALKRWNIGQQIREEGPQGHMAKRGTPTMGGVLDCRLGRHFHFAVGQVVECLCLTVVIATLAFGAIGFADDYLKLARQKSLGLTGKQKLLGQLLIAIGVWLVMFILTKYFASDYSWNVSIPFIKATAVPDGISFIGPVLYLFFIIIVLMGFSNAVNLTDGLDGLAISVTFIAMTALTGLTYLSSDARWARYLELTHRPEAAELTVFCGAMAGASLGFLWYQRAAGGSFYGRCREPGDWWRDWHGRGADQTGVHAADGGRRVCDRGAFGDAASERLQNDQAHHRDRPATV